MSSRINKLSLLLDVGFYNNLIVYDNQHTEGVLTKRLISLAKVQMRRRMSKLDYIYVSMMDCSILLDAQNELFTQPPFREVWSIEDPDNTEIYMYGCPIRFLNDEEHTHLIKIYKEANGCFPPLDVPGPDYCSSLILIEGTNELTSGNDVILGAY